MAEKTYFSEEELKCKCGCGRADMDPAFMEKLIAIRKEYGKPMILSSAYRCPNYNARIAGSGRNGPHTTGKAVDVVIRGVEAHRLAGIALKHGVKGLGVSQRGRHETRFLHLDTIDGPTRPWIWSY